LTGVSADFPDISAASVSLKQSGQLANTSEIRRSSNCNRLLVG